MTPKTKAERRERAREIIQAHLDQAEPWDLFIALPISAVRAVMAE